MEYVSIGLEGLLHKNYPYCGKERKLRSKKDFILLRDEYDNTRIIYTINGEWIGCLHLINNIAYNVFVLENHRRKGISGKLIEYAYYLFKNIEFSGNVNELSSGMINKYKK